MKNLLVIIVLLFAILFIVVMFFHNNNASLSKAENTMGKKNGNLEKATLAGGCFWCLEADLEKLDGVISAVSGYAGGKEKDPTYKNVSAGITGHREVVEVIFDSSNLSYEQLLDFFWRRHNPTDDGGQFADRGNQYRPAIFYHNEKQKEEAFKSKNTLIKSGNFKDPITTQILPAGHFYPAEDYHQNYGSKNPMDYKLYRQGSGRDAFLEQSWGEIGKERIYNKPSDKQIRDKLTDIQYRVTQKEATEPPYKNEHWDNKAPGIYVDVVSGEPLFASLDKFNSGSGWPSFTKPLARNNIVEKVDIRLGLPRVEVRSKQGDSHLGHVFKDGPMDKGGLRYCVNSAALKFIPVKEMEKEGFGELLKLFKE